MAITGRRPTLTDCGCEVTVYADGSGIELHYCPIHQAALPMLKALYQIVKGEGRFSRDPLTHASNTIEDMKALALAAIAAAGG
ncbi:MAG: hypothetical protein MUP86_02225 [Dehalococcoidia bacterium]|nr:hypothetical protein [Dehalococcoidia bacterium]